MQQTLRQNGAYLSFKSKGTKLELSIHSAISMPANRLTPKTVKLIEHRGD